MNDTICAIATSQGVGAIAIIRISGEDSIKVVNKIFKGKEITFKKGFKVLFKKPSTAAVTINVVVSVK